MTTPANYDFIIRQDETFQKTLTIRELDTENSLDLTGYSAELEAEQRDGTNTLSFSPTINGSAGEIVLSKTATQTEALAPGRYDYDLKLTDGSGNSEFVLKGIIYVEETI